MNILVTGCAGFIGNILWKRLQEKYTLIGIDNLSREISIMPEKKLGQLLFLEDINNINTINLPKLDAIIHLAAQVSVVNSLEDPLGDLRTNAEGTLKMCLLAKKHNCKLIYSSTNKVFGELIDVFEPISDEKNMAPETPYGISKAAGAQYVLDIVPKAGYVFHQSCIYGETQKGTLDQGWIGWLKNNIFNNRPITCFGDGTQVRDLLHVDDLIDLYEMALEDKLSPGSYVTGGGIENAYSFFQVVNMLGGKIEKFDNWRSHDQKYFVSLNQKLYKSGWRPKVKFSEWCVNE